MAEELPPASPDRELTAPAGDTLPATLPEGLEPVLGEGASGGEAVTPTLRQESTIAPSPSAAPAPPFSALGTVLWSAALAAGLVFIVFSVSANREHLLEQPERYLDRVLGRDLDAAEYSPHLPVWIKLLSAWDTSELSEARQDAIDGYREFLDSGALAEPDHARQVLAVLLAESGEMDQAQEQLKGLENPAAASEFTTAFAQAYATNAIPSPTAARLAVDPRLTPDWARNKLELRLAERRGESGTVRQIEDQLVRRGHRWQSRANGISLVNFLLVASGFAATLVWWWRGRPSLAIAEGMVVSPWAMKEGYAVLVRGAVMGMVLAGGMGVASEYVPSLGAGATLVSAMPLLLLTRKHLLPSSGPGLPSATGLVLAPGTRLKWIWLTLTLAAILVTGETILGALTSRWQAGPLLESIPEEFLFDPWPAVLLSAVDAIVWAPLVEEIAFRGLLYPTLRRRLSMVPAGALSAAIFATVHGYSLQGFLIIFWSGFVWALMYEKTRSLWPGILCHALSNVLAFISPVLLYRI